MTPDGRERGARRTRRLGIAVAGGALLYVLLGFLPWVSVTFDVVGRMSSSGHGLSPLVPVSAVLLVAAGVWVLLPVSRWVSDRSARPVVPLGLAAVAVLLTLVTWLRTTDFGFQAVPLVALLVTVAVAAAAASSLLQELRAASGADTPASPEPPAGSLHAGS